VKVVLRALAPFPGAALAMLPSMTCPACIAAYAGVLSAAGLGFLLDNRVLAPLIAFALAAGVVSVAWTTRSHRRLGPLVATLAGAAAVLAGRLVWDVPWLVYAGAAALAGAALWNLWLKRPAREPLLPIRLARKEGEA
jgi:hypothetical protein